MTTGEKRRLGTKAKALAVAKRFGFVLDENVSGKTGEYFAVTFDHPTHSICGDCRSIHAASYGDAFTSAAADVWSEVIERMEAEGVWLKPCADPECDYHCEGE